MQTQSFSEPINRNKQRDLNTAKQIVFILSGLSERHKMSGTSFLLLMVIMDNVVSISFEIRQFGPSTVELPSGEVRGLLVTFKDSHWTPVEVYRGLHYGSLGNEGSSFNTQWNKTMSANRWANVCPQVDIGGVNSLKDLLKVLPRVRVIRLYHRSNYTKNQMEDCLALNVFLPSRGKFYVHSDTES